MLSLNRKKGIEFPDAVTYRGEKAFRHLMLANKQGYRATYLMFLTYTGGFMKLFGIASDIDPEIYFLKMH